MPQSHQNRSTHAVELEDSALDEIHRVLQIGGAEEKEELQLRVQREVIRPIRTHAV